MWHINEEKNYQLSKEVFFYGFLIDNENKIIIIYEICLRCIFYPILEDQKKKNYYDIDINLLIEILRKAFKIDIPQHEQILLKIKNEEKLVIINYIFKYFKILVTNSIYKR